MLRLGLCCQFTDEPIKFRTTTVKHCSSLSTADRISKLDELCRHNANALFAAIQSCSDLGIGAFRVNSQILPLKTHDACGYDLQDLPSGDATIARFHECRNLAAQLDVRLSFHPDQFVVLNSPREDVVAGSIAEIEYQSQVAQWIGADCVNIHGGGAYGDKRTALDRFIRNVDCLSDTARSRLTVENDDKVYSPEELLAVCKATGIPLTYDVHHHRCHGDRLTIDHATEAALETWNREPLFHISSPIAGWDGPKPARHHDFIDASDFPDCWRSLDITIDVEAKAKEHAVARLARDLQATPSLASDA